MQPLVLLFCALKKGTDRGDRQSSYAVLHEKFPLALV